MALTNAEHQRRWRERRNALAKQAMEQGDSPQPGRVDTGAVYRARIAELVEEVARLRAQPPAAAPLACSERAPCALLLSKNERLARAHEATNEMGAKLKMLRKTKAPLPRAMFVQILSCLSPDSRNSTSDEKLNRAFDAFKRCEFLFAQS